MSEENSYQLLFEEDESVIKGEETEFFVEQAVARLTGKTLDGTDIPFTGIHLPEYSTSVDYIVSVLNDNKEVYNSAAQGVLLHTAYGSVALDTVSKNYTGRFNLEPELMTGRLIFSENGFEAGQLVVFNAFEIMSVSIPDRDFSENTDALNPAFGDINYMGFPTDEAVTYKGYEDGSKEAYEITLYKDNAGQKNYYIEMTPGYPVAKGNIDTSFTTGSALSVLQSTVHRFTTDSDREFVFYNIHDWWHTNKLVKRAINLPEYSIYQLKDDDRLHDYRFEPYSRLISSGHTVSPDNYKLVYNAPLPENMNIEQIISGERITQTV